MHIEDRTPLALLKMTDRKDGQTASFQKSTPWFEVDFSLKVTQSATCLIIDAVDKKTKEIFKAHLNQYTLLLNYNNISRHFKTLIGLFRHLQVNFEDVRVLQRKQLQIQLKACQYYSYELIFDIETEDQEVKWTDGIASKEILEQIKKLRDIVSSQKKQIEGIVAARVSTVKDYETENLQLKYEIQNLRYSSHKHQINSQKLAPNKRKFISKPLHNTKKTNSSPSEKPKTAKSEVSTVISVKINHHLIKSFLPHCHHLPNHTCFAICGPKMQNLHKVSHDSCWINFVLAGRLENQSVYSLKIELADSESRQIALGVVTSELFGFEGDSKCCIGLDCSTGDVEIQWQKVGKAEDASIKEGDRVRIEVDMINMSIRWHHQVKGETKEEQIAEVFIPFEMEEMFLAVSIKNSRDQISLIEN